MASKQIQEYAHLAATAAEVVLIFTEVFSRAQSGQIGEDDAARLERAVARYREVDAEFDEAVASLREFAETMPIED